MVSTRGTPLDRERDGADGLPGVGVTPGDGTDCGVGRTGCGVSVGWTDRGVGVGWTGCGAGTDWAGSGAERCRTRCDVRAGRT